MLGCKKEPSPEAVLRVGGETESGVIVIEAELGRDASMEVQILGIDKRQDDEVMAHVEVAEERR